MIFRKYFLIFISLILGILSVILFHEDNTHYDPGSFSVDSKLFRIEKVQKGEFMVFNIKNEMGKIVDSSLGGTTGHFCDPPYIIRYEMNNDDNDDIYLHNCAGHGYLHYNSANKIFEYENLGQNGFSDKSISPGWFFDLIESRFLIPIAALIGIIAIVFLVMAIVLKFIKK